MRHTYLLVAAALFAIGLWYAANDIFNLDNPFSGLGILFGLVFLLTATLNVLNCYYGHIALGIRVATWTSNLVLLALLIWWHPSAWDQWLVLALLVIALLLSFARQARRGESTV
jgi:hypothetical protein